MDIDLGKRLPRALTGGTDLDVDAGSRVSNDLAKGMGKFLLGVFSVSVIDSGGRGTKVELHELSFGAGS